MAEVATIITPPGDKSITHRGFLMAGLFDAGWQGPIVLRNPLDARDIDASVRAARGFGADIETDDATVRILPGGTRSNRIACGRSGTTMRLAAGLAAASDMPFHLGGDAQLLRRPMERVAEVLRPLGADIEVRDDGIHTRPAKIQGTEVALPVASAQLKSAVLLCAAKAKVSVTIHSPAPSRDHTERILLALGHSITSSAGTTTFVPGRAIGPLHIDVPGDPSSSSFFLAAGLLSDGGRVTLRRVSSNPTRSGFLDIVHRMGANIELASAGVTAGEPYADMIAESSNLKAVRVHAQEVPACIDELPLLAMLATQAHGSTEIRGAHELRTKESDRIASTASELSRLGANIKEHHDGWSIQGPTPLTQATVESHDDHRIAMMLHTAALTMSPVPQIMGDDCVADSYPGFFSEIQKLRRQAK